MFKCKSGGSFGWLKLRKNYNWRTGKWEDVVQTKESRLCVHDVESLVDYAVSADCEAILGREYEDERIWWGDFVVHQVVTFISRHRCLHLMTDCWWNKRWSIRKCVESDKASWPRFSLGNYTVDHSENEESEQCFPPTHWIFMKYFAYALSITFATAEKWSFNQAPLHSTFSHQADSCYPSTAKFSSATVSVSNCSS